MRFFLALIAVSIALGFCGEARADDCFDAYTNAEQTGNWSRVATICGQAAEQGSVDAQLLLGTMYLDGLGVPQDIAQAEMWLRRAAEQGHPVAQHYLGGMYLLGYGVARDAIEAEKWYRLAAEQGLAESQTALGLYYRYQDPEAAVELLTRAAEQGDALAQAALADIYYLGDGVSQDYAKAAKWSRLAAAQGDVGSQERLGDMYLRGRGVPQDYAEAANWFHKVAERTGGRQGTLCKLYMEGKGVPQDDVQAHMWCSLAAMGDAHSLPSERLREKLERRMTPSQIAAAEQLARTWVETHEWFAPDPIVACDLGKRGVIHTKRSTCAEEGGRPADENGQDRPE